MAFSSVTALGTVGVEGSAAVTTAVITLGADAEAGRFVLVLIGADNLATSDGTTSEISSVVDSAGGNTWVSAGRFCNAQGGARLGAYVDVWYSVLTNQINSGGTITATKDSANDFAATAYKVTLDSGSTVAVAGTVQTLANDIADPGSMAISGLSSKEYFFLRCVSSEAEDTTGPTPTTSHTAIAGTISGTAGAPTSNIRVSGEYLVLTGTGDTSDPTLFVTDHASVFIAFEEVLAGGGVSIAVPGGNLLLSSFAPTIVRLDNRSIAVPSANLLLSTFAPGISAANNVAISIPSGDLALSTFAPSVSVSANRAIEIPSGNLSVSTFAPTVSTTANRSIEVPSANLLLSTSAPTTAQTTSASIAPPSANLALSTSAPDLATSAGVSRSIPSADLLLSTSAPSVAATANRAIAVPSANLSLTTSAPLLGVGFSFEIPPANLTLSASAPTVAETTHRAISVLSADLVLSPSAPVVDVVVNRAIEIPAANLLLTTSPIGLASTLPLEVPSAQLALTTSAPELVQTGGHLVDVPSADLVLTTSAPLVSFVRRKATGTRPGGLQGLGGTRGNAQGRGISRLNRAVRC